jgi:hypothetical protein
MPSAKINQKTKKENPVDKPTEPIQWWSLMVKQEGAIDTNFLLNMHTN